MAILDRIKSFFKRAKPVAEVAKEKPPEVTEGKPPEATKEKPAETIRPRKKATKPTGKKVPAARRRKRAA